MSGRSFVGSSFFGHWCNTCFNKDAFLREYLSGMLLHIDRWTDWICFLYYWTEFVKFHCWLSCFMLFSCTLALLYHWLLFILVKTSLSFSLYGDGSNFQVYQYWSYHSVSSFYYNLISQTSFRRQSFVWLNGMNGMLCMTNVFLLVVSNMNLAD